MTKRIPAIGLLLLVAGWAADQPLDSFARMRGLFSNPPAAYRTLPFFVWNGEVTEVDIDRFVEDFHTQGMGGFFIHPRPS